jgi:folylpolyglutamate synthase/dihydropteroate synthase
MSDQWETFCDVGYYHMWRLRRKTERGWNDGFHINTRDEAEGLCELLNKLEREVAEAKEQCSNLDDQVSAAMMVIRGLERERDRLAEALRELCETLLNDKPRDITESLYKAGDALAAWKGGPQ